MDRDRDRDRDRDQPSRSKRRRRDHEYWVSGNPPKVWSSRRYRPSGYCGFNRNRHALMASQDCCAYRWYSCRYKVGMHLMLWVMLLKGLACVKHRSCASLGKIVGMLIGDALEM